MNECLIHLKSYLIFQSYQDKEKYNGYSCTHTYSFLKGTGILDE